MFRATIIHPLSHYVAGGDIYTARISNRLQFYLVNVIKSVTKIWLWFFLLKVFVHEILHTCESHNTNPLYVSWQVKKTIFFYQVSRKKVLKLIYRFSISICQNKENYITDILIYLEAMRNLFNKLFLCSKKATNKIWSNFE